MTETAADPVLRIGVLGGHRPSDIETVLRGPPRQLGIALIVSCGGAPDIAGMLRSVSALPLTEVDSAQEIEPDHIQRARRRVHADRGRRADPADHAAHPSRAAARAARRDLRRAPVAARH